MATPTRCGLMLLTCFAAAVLIATQFSRARLAMGGCGPRSLYAIGRRLGLPQSCGSVSRLFPGGSQTANFAQIQRAAQRLGLHAQGREMTLNELRRVQTLGILHVDSDHFVALVGYEADAVWVADPAYAGEPRRVRWLYADLAGRWDGRILVIERH